MNPEENRQFQACSATEAPTDSDPRLQLFAGVFEENEPKPSFRESIETRTIAGMPVRMHPTAIQLPKVAWRKRQLTTEDLHRFARVCRVHDVMPPYQEGVLE